MTTEKFLPVERLTFAPDGPVDELVAHNADVHLEILDDRAYMLIVENERFHVHLRIHVNKGRGKYIDSFVYEQHDR